MKSQSRSKSNSLIRLFTWAVLAGTVFSLPAAANLIANGSFENGTFLLGANAGEALAAGSTVMTGWAVVSPGAADIVWLQNGNVETVSTPFGNRFLDLTGSTDAAPFAGVSQTIATIVGTSYMLTYSLGVDQSGGLDAGPVGITADAGSTTGNCDNYNPPGGGNQWETCTLNFTASSATTAISLYGDQGILYIGLDNVDVEAASSPTPEPALALPLLAALGMLVTRRRV